VRKHQQTLTASLLQRETLQASPLLSDCTHNSCVPVKVSITVLLLSSPYWPTLSHWSQVFRHWCWTSVFGLHLQSWVLERYSTSQNNNASQQKI